MYKYDKIWYIGGEKMEIKDNVFYVLKGEKNHIYTNMEEAVNQIKKNKNTNSTLMKVDISSDKWELSSVGWDKIAQYLLEG